MPTCVHVYVVLTVYSFDALDNDQLKQSEYELHMLTRTCNDILCYYEFSWKTRSILKIPSSTWSSRINSNELRISPSSWEPLGQDPVLVWTGGD